MFIHGTADLLVHAMPMTQASVGGGGRGLENDVILCLDNRLPNGMMLSNVTDSQNYENHTHSSEKDTFSWFQCI